MRIRTSVPARTTRHDVSVNVLHHENHEGPRREENLRVKKEKYDRFFTFPFYLFLESRVLRGESKQLRSGTSGFTLLETITVITILAIVSGVVVVNYRGPVNQARLESTMEQINTLDRRIRLRCRQHNGPVRLKIHPDKGLFYAESDDPSMTPVVPVKLGSGMVFGELHVFDSDMPGLTNFTIPYSSDGIAPLWCYSLRLPDGGEFYRLMFGATGQSITLDNEEQLDKWRRFVRETTEGKKEE